jgi:site-specific DNA-methyltransferase (adenine-specific)/modification methylase
MNRIPDDSVHLILCDLPYGTTQNKWDSVIPLDELWYQYRRVLVPGGVVALTGQGSFTARLILSNESWYKYKMVWVKSKATNFLNARHQPLRKHEDIVVFYGSRRVYNPLMQPGTAYDKGERKSQQTGSYRDFDPVRVKSKGSRYPTDVVYFKTAESEGKVYHSTQKPVNLGRYLVRTFTNPGEVVLDNAFGSGSFLVSALLEGRNFYGIELNETTERFKNEVNWFDITRERLYGAWLSLDETHRDWLKPVGELSAKSFSSRPN